MTRYKTKKNVKLIGLLLALSVFYAITPTAAATSIAYPCGEFADSFAAYGYASLGTTGTTAGTNKVNYQVHPTGSSNTILDESVSQPGILNFVAREVHNSAYGYGSTHAKSEISSMKLDLLAGTIVVAAEVIQNQASATSGGASASAELVGLTIGTPAGVNAFTAAPPANTVVPLGPAGYVVVNEQIQTGSAAESNALHFYLNPTGADAVEIIVSHARASYDCEPCEIDCGPVCLTEDLVPVVVNGVETCCTTIKGLGTNGCFECPTDVLPPQWATIDGCQVCGNPLDGAATDVSDCTCKAIGTIHTQYGEIDACDPCLNFDPTTITRLTPENCVDCPAQLQAVSKVCTVDPCLDPRLAAVDKCVACPQINNVVVANCDVDACKRLAACDAVVPRLP